MTKQNKADRAAISLIERVNETRNTLLVMFADCKQLKAFRSEAHGLSDYGSYLAPRSAKKPVKMPRARFAKLIGAQFEKQKVAIKKAQEEAAARIKSSGLETNMQNNVNLGLIHRDDNAAYTGLLQTWYREGAELTRVATVTALTLVRKRVIS